MSKKILARSREEAAEERARRITQRADRPSQRRSSPDSDFRGWTASSRALIEVRQKSDGAGAWDFRGVASVTETPYEMYDMFGEYREVVSAGAFTQTLARADLDVPLVLGHDSMLRLARTTTGTLQLSEDESGLVVDAQMDPENPHVQTIVPLLRSGLIDEMSFAFRIESGMWSPDYDEFRIDRVDIHRGDVSIVGYGANPYTSAELRQQPAADLRAVKLRLATEI